MNLDELKILLNQKLEATESAVKSVAQLQQMLHAKSSSIIHKIKRSVLFEIAFTFLFFIGFSAIYFVSKQRGIAIYFGTFAILCIPFAFILIYLLKRINIYLNSSLDVKTNLTKLYNLIDDFCKKYFQFTMAIIPIAFIFSIYLGTDFFAENNSYSTSIQKNTTSKNVFYGFLIGYIIAVGFGIYKFTKWYIKKLYGNYLQEIKIMLDDL